MDDVKVGACLLIGACVVFLCLMAVIVPVEIWHAARKRWRSLNARRRRIFGKLMFVYSGVGASATLLIEGDTMPAFMAARSFESAVIIVFAATGTFFFLLAGVQGVRRFIRLHLVRARQPLHFAKNVVSLPDLRKEREELPQAA